MIPLFIFVIVVLFFMLDQEKSYFSPSSNDVCGAFLLVAYAVDLRASLWDGLCIYFLLVGDSNHPIVACR